MKGGWVHEHPYLKVRRVVILLGIPSTIPGVSVSYRTRTLVPPHRKQSTPAQGGGRRLLLVASSPNALCVFYSGHPSIEPPTASHSTVNQTLGSGARVSTPTRPSILTLLLSSPGRSPGINFVPDTDVSLTDMQRVPLASRPATGLPYGKRACKAFCVVPPDVSLGSLLLRIRPPLVENILAPANLVRP